MGQWSDLPRDLLNTIEEHLTLLIDRVRIRAVCLSWKSHLPKMMRNGLPSLLGVFENNNNSLGLFNLIEQKYDLLYIPELQGKSFRGSSHGWVAVHEDIPEGWVLNLSALDNCDEDISDDDIPVEGNPDEDIPVFLASDTSEKNIPSRVFQASANSGEDIPNGNVLHHVFPASSPNIYLINPFTGVQIQLPPRYAFPDVREYHADRVGQEYTLIIPEYYDPVDSNLLHQSMVYKIVLSSSPLRKDCVAVAIYGQLGTLAWCKCNDKSWTPIGDTDFIPPFPAFEDIIFYKDQLHALNTKGQLIVFENIGTDRKVTETIVANARHTPCRPYLVECSDGGLLMVEVVEVEEIDAEEDFEVFFKGFEVYKLDSNTSTWRKVDNIGDDMIFLGLNYSLAISAHKIPGYKGNCIYFADEPSVFIHRWDKSFHSRLGVFNMTDRTIESLPGFELPKFFWPPPVWITMPNCN